MKSNPNLIRPFKGMIGGDVSLRLGGRTYCRAIQVSWAMTPAWPYIDPATNVEVVEKPFLDFSLQIQPKPSEHAELGIKAWSDEWTPVPVSVLELLAPYGSFHDLLDLADKRARTQDHARRLSLRPPRPDIQLSVKPVKYRQRKPKE